MDVRCERCKTDYEFDDTRITEAGVTVKCTTCGHVFKVKKKALVVTVPVKPEDGTDGVSSGTAPPMGAKGTSGEKPATKDKEWKVRQSNGNVFSFKELTTLQKWIVERKVNREDEISLTGESWKRLGNIAELASFFQVVDDAQKGQLASLGPPLGYMPPGATPAGGYAIPSGDGGGALGYANPGLRAPSNPGMPGVMLQQPTPYPGSQSGAITQPNMPAAITSSSIPAMAQTIPAMPQVNVTVQSQPAIQAATPPGQTSQSNAVMNAALPQAQKQGGGAVRALLVLLILAVLGVGGVYGYIEVWVPKQKAAELDEQTKAAAERKAAEERGAAAEKARKTAEDAAKAAAATAAADAGTVLAAAHAADKKPRDFDGWMLLADKLREKDKSEAALDAYGKAADLKPDRAEPHAGRGWALLDMGSKLQAEASFEQALKLNPRYGVALMGLAETYRAEGKKEQAIKFYTQYLDVLPNGPEANVARQALKRLQE